MQSSINTIEAIKKQFGNIYKNLEKCGQGSYSEVFKCQNQNGEYVAIKVIDKSSIDSDQVPYFNNEKELLSINNNQNVIKLYEYQESDQTLFFVLEFCQMDVAQMMTKYYNNRIPEDIVIIILKNIMNGLQSLHKNNIIHRDLKLENIGVVIKEENLIKLASKQENKYDLIFKQASYKLLDLGLAKQVTNQTKTFAGTQYYMAPEVIDGRFYSFQVDMYSLGVCLYQMITGKHPYKGNNYYTQYKKIKQQEANFQVIENQLLRNIIQQMLQFDVEKRLKFQELYQSQLIKNLQETQPSILEISLTMNTQFYIINESNIIQKEDIQQENEQKIQNQQIHQQIQNNTQFFENFKNSQLYSQTQESSIIQTQEFSVIEYPQQQKKSQIGKSKSPLEQNQEIIQVKEITRWKKQKNICMLIQRLCKKLQIFIQQIPSDINYSSFEGEFTYYLKYYCKFSEKLLKELQVEVNSKNHYQKIQEYQIFKDSLKNIQLINLQDMQSNLFSNLIYTSRTYFNQVNSIFEIKDDNTLENQKNFLQKNNKIIFKQIRKISQNLYYKEDQAMHQFTQVQCLIYLILVDLAILYAEYLNGNTILDDTQIIELKPEDFQNNPDHICSFLFDIMEQNKLSFTDIQDIQ
ncbi:unnamed protein product [Paramecium primaurelia]|uniref:Protein kinase domain-containing protein n=1 Tax=Paramecium primaurelia TaxID=5886 RepID=A0A8S1MTW6_PARPR|nr:unnamed protein product [Paramecium primaurelia]